MKFKTYWTKLLEKNLHSFYFIFQYVYVCVSLCGYVQVTANARENIRLPGVEVIGSC